MTSINIIANIGELRTQDPPLAVGIPHNSEVSIQVPLGSPSRQTPCPAPNNISGGLPRVLNNTLEMQTPPEDTPGDQISKSEVHDDGIPKDNQLKDEHSTTASSLPALDEIHPLPHISSLESQHVEDDIHEDGISKEDHSTTSPDVPALNDLSLQSYPAVVKPQYYGATASTLKKSYSEILASRRRPSHTDTDEKWKAFRADRPRRERETARLQAERRKLLDSLPQRIDELVGQIEAMNKVSRNSVETIEMHYFEDFPGCGFVGGT